MQKVVERARCHAEMWRQPAVECMRYLIEVVADAPQFREQRGVDPVDGGLSDFDGDAAAQDAPLAISGDLESELQGGDRQPLVIRVAHADVDLTVAALRISRRNSRHVTPLKSWVRGAGSAS